MNKNEIYNQLNWDAKLFIEDIVRRFTISPYDMDPVVDNSKLREYEDQILDLYNKNLLFFIKTLFEFKSDSSVSICNTNGIFDNAMPLLELLNINVKESEESESDITVEFVDSPYLLLEFFINREPNFSGFSSNYRLITCERNSGYTIYMILPSRYNLATNDEMLELYDNIQFHFDELDNLTFSDDYKQYTNYFLTIKVIEK